ncbi:12640_t:CDS:2 [Acaulospora colombiana]|uniref:12640_t:CDS:1 n=1 Tax=Acaulospora colombiana TaxID=27376 RepID=A0ACA9KEJ8_9GLOM|nr:12640_t:CDS:2 [Acaulospora colombiana]
MISSENPTIDSPPSYSENVNNESTPTVPSPVYTIPRTSPTPPDNALPPEDNSLPSYDHVKVDIPPEYPSKPGKQLQPDHPWDLVPVEPQEPWPVTKKLYIAGRRYLQNSQSPDLRKLDVAMKNSQFVKACLRELLDAFYRISSREQRIVKRFSQIVHNELSDVNVIVDFSNGQISTVNPDYCSFYLVSICKKQKIDSNWNRCLPAKLYFKRSDGRIYKEFDILKMESIVEGVDNFCKRVSLHIVNVIGVKFSSTRFVEDFIEPPFPKPIPENLISAWSSELDRPDKANVKINVQGQTIYASSTILAKRSEYFQRIFEGEWAECNRDVDVPMMTDDLVSNPSTSPPSSFSSNKSEVSVSRSPSPTLRRYKYEINITDFKYRTVLQMLNFLYTNQLPICKDGGDDEDGEDQDIWELYSIADKYLLTDLQSEIKSNLTLKTDRKNAAEMLFKYAWRWKELKAIMMPYV